MTNAEAHAYSAKYPHISIETVAYNQGRFDVEDNGKVWPCEFTEPALVEAWKRGVRSMRAEIRLNNDTEWD